MNLIAFCRIHEYWWYVKSRSSIVINWRATFCYYDSCFRWIGIRFWYLESMSRVHGVYPILSRLSQHYVNRTVIQVHVQTNVKFRFCLFRNYLVNFFPRQWHLFIGEILVSPCVNKRVWFMICFHEKFIYCNITSHGIL